MSDRNPDRDHLHEEKLGDHYDELERREAEDWPECDSCGHHVDPEEAVTCELCSSVLCEWDAVPLDLEDATWRCKGRHYFDETELERKGAA